MGIANFYNGNDDDNNQNGNGAPVFPGVPAGMSGMMSGNQDSDDILINYNEKATDPNNKMNPVLFRDNEIQQLLSVLLSKNKPNAILTGPAGVGKTVIVEELARLIATDDPIVPDRLKGMVIKELPLSALVSGCGIVGALEEKLNGIIDEAKDPDNHEILFIDEIHQLVKNNSDSYAKVAQILKPALARGEIRVIGATTTQEAKELMDDPAFGRRFSKIIVNELTKDQTVEILRQALPGLMAFNSYKIKVDDTMLPTVVELAEEYKPAGGHRPDTALTLLDRAIGDAIVNRKKQEIELAKDPANAQALKVLQSMPQVPVTEKQVKATAIKLATGNSKPESIDEDKLSTELTRIKGQDEAVEKVTKELKKHELHLFPSNQPLTMLFIGPSGVGKTEISKILSQAVTGCPPIVLNMTEYSDPSTINKIIGSPAGYVGSDSNAELPFDILESNPYQFILLDEFEKAHPSVQKLFMQVFDEGVLKTNRGDTIDFSKSIIVATTNAGHTTAERHLGFGADNEKKATTDVSQLTRFFDPALLNRFQVQITFNGISKDVYRDICRNTYQQKKDEILKAKPYTVLPDEIDDAELDKMVEETYEAEFGARPINHAVEEYIYSVVM